jgi:hypothetical protein
MSSPKSLLVKRKIDEETPRTDLITDFTCTKCGKTPTSKPPRIISKCGHICCVDCIELNSTTKGFSIPRNCPTCHKKPDLDFCLSNPLSDIELEKWKNTEVICDKRGCSKKFLIKNIDTHECECLYVHQYCDNKLVKPTELHRHGGECTKCRNMFSFLEYIKVGDIVDYKLRDSPDAVWALAIVNLITVDRSTRHICKIAIQTRSGIMLFIPINDRAISRWSMLDIRLPYTHKTTIPKKPIVGSMVNLYMFPRRSPSAPVLPIVCYRVLLIDDKYYWVSVTDSGEGMTPIPINTRIVLK